MNSLHWGFSQRAAKWLLLALFGLSAWSASAAGLSPKDETQILEVVQAQFDAFAKDDAATAFSYAAPNIRQMAGTAQNFIAMVRNQYAAVYRPASTSFTQPLGEDGKALLRVNLTDADGQAWIAAYTLQKQPDARWRITGCTLTATTATMV